MVSMIPTSYGSKLVENWLLSSLTAFRYDSSNTSLPFLPNVAGAHASSSPSMAVVPFVLDMIGGRVSLRKALPVIKYALALLLDEHVPSVSVTFLKTRTTIGHALASRDRSE